ncbi:MAG TPA: ABC transporter permease [Acidimicrobiales bacterium]|nr:ABC transporter permease [Acidimicrobiales bacterium]
MNALVAQIRAETRMSLRRGESLLVTLGIPLLLLLFFGTVDLLPTGDRDQLEFLVPSILALAVMSTAMVNLAISTGFERQYGVLKRLGATPLGRPRLMVAKTAVVVLVETIQVVAVTFLGLVLGWRPDGSVGLALVAVGVGTVAFAGLGLLMAGALRAEATLAVANGLYVVLLLVGGIAVPLESLPAAIGALAALTPSAALAQVLVSILGGDAVPIGSWLVLGFWALAAPAAAIRLFRWE